MLRVFFLVDHARAISGPHRHVVSSLNALSRREDVRLRLLCGDFDENEPFALSPGLEIQTGYNPHDIRNAFENVRRILAASRDCDVIYVPSGLKSMLYSQIARLRRTLIVGPNVTHLPVRKADSPGNFELNVLCDGWIEASDARRSHVVNYTANEKVRMVHHGIDTGKWGPHRRKPTIWEQFGVPAQALKILFACQKDIPLKGAPQLLTAFARALQRTKQQLHLVVAGRMSESTLKMIREVGSASAVGFVGPDVLPALYASADISVVPSSWEAFSFTTLESLASGVATIASRVGGIPEQIIDGESGILLDLVDDGGTHLPEAAERIAESLIELAEAPDLRARLGAAARQRVLDAFSEDRLAQNLVDVFRSTRALRER